MSGEEPAATRPVPGLGVVVIGRNEGERLDACLRSVIGRAEEVVYVDSGSSDGSVERAAQLGARVVRLEPPFTAARGRNAGFDLLAGFDVGLEAPGLAWIHFVDGDCEVCPGWLEAATRFLRDRDDVSLVLGRRRERRPEASRWNRLIDMEWDAPTGEGHVYGGDMLIRASALRSVGGYDPNLIAGEDPELTLRMLRAGLRGARLGRDMTLHDAAMSHFSQWWQRSVRSGHAYAELAWLHRADPGHFRRREVASVLFWAALVPVATGAATFAFGALGLAPLALYALLWRRVWSARRAMDDPPENARLYATACVVGKFAALQGLGTFVRNRLLQRRTSLIEYKRA